MLMGQGFLCGMLYNTVDKYVSVFYNEGIAGLLIDTADIENGFGRHIYIFRPVDRLEKARLWLRCLFIFELFFHTATTLAKFAV